MTGENQAEIPEAFSVETALQGFQDYIQYEQKEQVAESTAQDYRRDP